MSALEAIALESMFEEVDSIPFDESSDFIMDYLIGDEYDTTISSAVNFYD